MLLSKLLERRFQAIPYSDSLCPCGGGEVETVGHVLVYCHFYQDLLKDLLSHIFLKFLVRSDKFYILLLLSDKVSYITNKVAKYCASAIACRILLITQGLRVSLLLLKISCLTYFLGVRVA